jgi:hypothetical protein
VHSCLVLRCLPLAHGIVVGGSSSSPSRPCVALLSTPHPRPCSTRPSVRPLVPLFLLLALVCLSVTCTRLAITQSRSLSCAASAQLPGFDGFASSYTLSGCNNPVYCGVFQIAHAHCTSGVHTHCTGDETLCDAAPVYRQEGADGNVLYRFLYSDGSTDWHVGPSSELGDCGGNYNYFYTSDRSDPDATSGLLSPDAPGYGWSAPDGYNSGRGSVQIVVGGEGGGH